MARVNNLTNFLTDVSSAIKQKTGDNTPIPASNFDTEILSIETGGNYQSKTLNVTQNGNYNLLPDQEFDALSNVNISVSVSPVLQNKTITENGSYTADQNYDGLGTVIVNVQGGTINNQDKTITQNGSYTADQGYTGLGTVTVNVPSGSGDVKLFETIAEMQADPDASEGDLAVVYREEVQPVTEESEFSSCTFPNTVVLDEAFTGSVFGEFRAVDPSVMFEGMVEMSSSYFRFEGYGESSEIRVEYTSQDGITYTRTDGGEELQEFGTTIKYEPMEPWNDVIGNFMKIGGNYFEGMYEYKSNEYVMTKNQLNATSDYVYEKTFYGKNGVENGTLGTPDNSFADTTAKAVYEIQNQYENMEPRILTDTDKTINKNIYFIPAKRNGTPLLDTSSVTDMNSMFDECYNLITIPLLDTSNAINMSYMFSLCSNLDMIPLLNTGNVTDMSYMFSSCSSLMSIPLLNASNVTNMSNMFYSCTSLTTVPLLDTGNVIDMSSMFSDCQSLTTIPLLDTGNVIDMSYMVLNCPALSNESLNNILAMCTNAVKITSKKTLKYIGLTQEQANICTTLSNYQDFVNAGWTTGY